MFNMYVKQGCKIILLLGLSSVLPGCEKQSVEPTLLSVVAPRSNNVENPRSFNDYDGAMLEVIINDGPVRVYNRQHSEQWTINVEEINMDAANSIFLRWYVVIDGTSYDISTQNETFIADSSKGSHTIVAPHRSSDFDHDNDLVSNLTELDAGGFPVSAEMLPEMIPISVSGCFLLGSPVSEHESLGYFNESQVEICGLSDYLIGRYEITTAQYRAYVLAKGLPFPDQIDSSIDLLPISNITWSEARDYTNWLSVISGRTFRLPTEAEWEYAARGGTETAFHTGNSIDISRANFSDSTARMNAMAVYFQTVGTTDARLIDGVFRITENRQWVEYGINRLSLVETARFVFDEIQRDTENIWLFDASRNTSIRLAVGSGEILLTDNTANDGLLYQITQGPNAYRDKVGRQALPVGSFPANAFGLQDMHGNVFEWTCSMVEPSYSGAEQICSDTAPTANDVSRMIKRGGSWGHSAIEARSANRGWNNTANTSDILTGFRVAMEL